MSWNNLIIRTEIEEKKKAQDLLPSEKKIKKKYTDPTTSIFVKQCEIFKQKLRARHNGIFVKCQCRSGREWATCCGMDDF